MIGKSFNAFKTQFSSGVAAAQSGKRFDAIDGHKLSAEGLPPAPQSAFRKRPVRLNYDANEYHMFRLPSEEQFLLGAFDKDELFGKRKGITHSPHIQAQTDLDTNLVWAIGAVTLLMMSAELKHHSNLKALRENFRNGDMGKFEEADFK